MLETLVAIRLTDATRRKNQHHATSLGIAMLAVEGSFTIYQRQTTLVRACFGNTVYRRGKTRGIRPSQQDGRDNIPVASNMDRQTNLLTSVTTVPHEMARGFK
uniref:Uncharacterized protein n=1 Tax=Picocystis salinarum TaxID=88271 RepID=A0A7S3XE28_9CHLO|mmetsp:Transcript_9943/g.35317  ORF Transcript_9943/g.35317 Transcript_9943/m.35317 type:complete len:103 (+) Transcript_9943:86-394(+)